VHHCQNCGGVLRVVEGRGRLQCDYCDASFPIAATETDRVRVIGGEVGVDCPQCSRSPLERAEIDQFAAGYCRTCRGLLLSSDDFAGLVRQRRAAGSDGPPPVPLNPDELERSGRCPECDRTMSTHPYYGPGNAVIDTCDACHVVWLDSGELRSIELAPGRR
jgi:Zn-finger nucleic acid-binding protein